MGRVRPMLVPWQGERSDHRLIWSRESLKTCASSRKVSTVADLGSPQDPGAIHNAASAHITSGGPPVTCPLHFPFHFLTSSDQPHPSPVWETRRPLCIQNYLYGANATQTAQTQETVDNPPTAVADLGPFHHVSGGGGLIEPVARRLQASNTKSLRYELMIRLGISTRFLVQGEGWRVDVGTLRGSAVGYFRTFVHLTASHVSGDVLDTRLHMKSATLAQAQC
jgi:hypothetical protein